MSGKKPRDWRHSNALPDWSTSHGDLPPLPEVETARKPSIPPWDLTSTFVATLSESRRAMLLKSYARQLKHNSKETDPWVAWRRGWLQNAIGLLQSHPPKIDVVAEGAKVENRPSAAAQGIANDCGKERRAAVDAYIEEVLKISGRRIKRTDIWKKAGDKSRSEFERWESCWYERHGRKPNKAANVRFTGILTKKPHLK